MKKNTKRVLACIAAVAMSCTMVTGLAANTATIESITVYDTDSTGAKTGAGTVIDIEELTAGSLNPSQIAEVKVVVDGDSPDAAEATFLSFIKGQEAALSNTTIQYVDQKTVANTGTEEAPVYSTTFTFRPRTTIGDNANGYANFVAKAGGSDVATADVAYYNVVAAPINISMAVVDNEVQLTTQDTATYTITGLTAVPETSTLTINSVAVDAANYAVTVAEGVYTLTINPAAYATLAAGPYDVTFTAPGYTTASAQIVVVAAPVIEEDIPEADVDDAKDAISAVEGTVSGSTATFTEKITVGGEEKTVKYDVVDADKEKVTVEGNTITLKNNLFAAKVTVTATVGGAAQGITTAKDVYIIPDMSKVSYGNFELVSDGSGACAFDDNTSFANAVAAEGFDQIAAKTKAEALAFVLGKKSEADKAPHFTQTLDYDHDGSIALAEYRILKLMLDNNLDNFKPEKLAIDRAAWLEAHPNN